MNNQTTSSFEEKIRLATQVPRPSPEFANELWSHIASRPRRQPFFHRSSPVFQVIAIGIGVIGLVAVLVLSTQLIPGKSVQPLNGLIATSTRTTLTTLPTTTLQNQPTPQETLEEPFTYKVKDGDTLQKIAVEVGMPAERIAELNAIDPSGSDIYPGMILTIGYQEVVASQSVDSILASPKALRLDTPHEDIRQRILQPQWETLWVEGEIRQPNHDSGVQEMVTWTQAYLAKDRRGRVLTSNLISGRFSFNMDVAVLNVAISDGQSQTRYDMSTKQADPIAVPSQWTHHPLEAVNFVTQMLFPSEMAIRSQDVHPLREEALAGRRALVLDWAEDRLWVDEETGMILRQERYAGSDHQQTPLYQAQINKLELGIDLVDAVLHPRYLDELAFEPQPTLAEPPSPSHLQNSSQWGWIYLESAGEAPYQWQVAVLPADCLADSQTCPAPILLPGHPNLQIMNLSWSPDNSMAVFSDTNHSKLIIYTPTTHEWQRVLDIFIQAQMAWSPDSNKIAGISAGDNGENNRLVVINRSDWTPRTIETGLDGEISVYGWFDEHTLLIGRRVSPAKGSNVPTELLAEVYRIDIDSGQSDLLVSGASEAALSPDKQKLVVSVQKEASTELMVANANGSNLHSLNVEGGVPSWSPNGQWIVFYDNHGNAISMVHPDGSDLRKNVVVNPLFLPVWSPDGKYMVTQAGGMTPASSWLEKTSVEDGKTQSIPMKMLDGMGIWQLLGWAK